MMIGVSAFEYKRRLQWALERKMPIKVTTEIRLKLSWANLFQEPYAFSERRNDISLQNKSEEYRSLCVDFQSFFLILRNENVCN
ncbi:MAG: hypothetical protein IJZ68_01005, partial [Bacteroidaceae bacterium]|nr:hypothetical protein [Bacteroidaceae bacterium]